MKKGLLLGVAVGVAAYVVLRRLRDAEERYVPPAHWEPPVTAEPEPVMEEPEPEPVMEEPEPVMEEPEPEPVMEEPEPEPVMEEPEPAMEESEPMMDEPEPMMDEAEPETPAVTFASEPPVVVPTVSHDAPEAFGAVRPRRGLGEYGRLRPAGLGTQPTPPWPGAAAGRAPSALRPTITQFGMTPPRRFG